MFRAYTVRVAFSAKQLHREPLRVEFFDPGALLVVLSTEDGHTTFCRHGEDADLDSRPRFIIGDERFAFLTEQL